MKNPKTAQRYFLKVIYQGTAYHGWQKQPKGQTIQNVLEEIIERIHIPTAVVGSGRTDTGVHALGQVAHIDLPPSVEPSKFRHQLNALLPAEIYVSEMRPVQPQAHARFDATHRSYRYHLSAVRDPFRHHTSYYYPYPLEVKRLNRTAAVLLGSHDFRSFCKQKSYQTHGICTVTEACWTQADSHLTFHITANRFLHHMVRSIVGTLLHLEKAQEGPEALRPIMAQQDRTHAGPNIPSQGLFLESVAYPPTLYLDF